jgi:hypothetical protein
MKNSKTETPLMTLSQYSRHRQVSRQYIAKLAKNGVLIMHGHLVDAVASDKVLDDKPGAAPPGGQTSASYAAARTIEMVFRAKLRRMEFENRQSQLIERAAVERRIAEHMAVLRDGLAGLVGRLAPVLAQETDARKVHKIFKSELVSTLAALARQIGNGGANGSVPSAH